MTPPSTVKIIIVDRTDSGVFNLAFNNLAGITNVVADVDAAIDMVKNSNIHIAVITYSRDPDTIAFCKTLSDLSIPYVLTGEPAARAPKPRNAYDVVCEMEQAVADYVMTILHGPTLH